MKASPESTNSCESERDKLDKSDTVLKLSRKSSEKLSFCNVQGRLNTWKKENTCKSCKITYENFQTLLNHRCVPFRCASCSMTFLFDYSLKMHKCGIQPSKFSHQEQCKICGSVFYDLNSLLHHQSSCTKTKRCSKCRGIFSVKNGNRFCRNCSSSERYSAREKSVERFEMTPISSEVSSSGIESSVDTDSVSTDRSSSTFNDVGRSSDFDYSKWRKKRKSVDNVPDISSKKIKSNNFIKHDRFKSDNTSSQTTDHIESAPNDISSRSLNSALWERKKTVKNMSNQFENAVKSKNFLSIDNFKNKFKTKRKFEKSNKNSLLLSKECVTNTSAIKLTVHQGLAKQDIKSDLKKSVVSVLSQTGKRNSIESNKLKFSSTSHNFSHEIKTSKDFEKSSNIASEYSGSLKKSVNLKTKKKCFSIKKTGLQNPAKSHTLNGNISNGGKKNNIEVVKKNQSNPVITSKKKVRSSYEKSYISSFDNDAGKSGISSVKQQNTVSPARNNFKTSLNQSKGNEQEKSTSAKEINMSDSCSDVIRLESILDVLPDKESGILLKESSNNFDNFRCPKCNKLFKKVKMAAIHYNNCKNFRLKKKMLVMRKSIEWVCLQCHFHCTQIPELTIHRRSCQKSFQFENSIPRSSDTSLNYCPKCSYSCISSHLFNQHPCTKRLEHMKKCYIEVKKLTTNNIPDVTKFECKFCESIFYHYPAYKKHMDKHTSDEFLDIPSCKAFNDKLYVRQEIKNIINEAPNLHSSDEAIKKVLEPISRVCSNVAPENPYHNLNLNFVIPKDLETLLLGAAEKILHDTNEEDHLNKVTKKLLSNREFASHFFNASTSYTDPCTPTDAWRTYMRDYKCEHYNDSNFSEERKPCLRCLNKYIEEKGFFYQPQETQTSSPTQTIPHTNLPEASTSEITDSFSLDLDNGFGLSDSVAMGSEHTMPIHVTFAESYDITAKNLEDMNSVSEANSLSCSESGLPEASNPDNISSEKNELDTKSHTMSAVVAVTIGFAANKYCVETHNTLMRNLFKLKQVCMPEDCTKLQDINDHEYYLSSDDIQKSTEEFLNHIILNNSHLSPSLDECALNSNADAIKDPSVKPVEYLRCYPIDSTTTSYNNCPTSTNSISESIYIQKNPKLYERIIKNSVGEVKNTVILQCSFEEIMKALMGLKPSDFDVIVITGEHAIHILWQTCSEITFSGYVEPNCKPSSINFICAHCFDTVSANEFLKHKIAEKNVNSDIYILVS